MNKAYVISTATAIALGYVAGFASEGLVAKAGTSKNETPVVEIRIGEAAEDTIEAWVVARACSSVDKELGLEGDDACDASILKAFRGIWVDDDSGVEGERDIMLSVRAEVSGTWTPGAPQ